MSPIPAFTTFLSMILWVFSTEGEKRMDDDICLVSTKENNVHHASPSIIRHQTHYDYYASAHKSVH